MQAYQPDHSETEVRDHRSFLEQAMDIALQRRIAFATIRVPGKRPVFFAQRDPQAIEFALNDQEKDLFVFAPFTWSGGPVWAIRPELSLNDTELLEELATIPLGPELPAEDQKEVDRSSHMGLVQLAMDRIATGELEKVVLSRSKVVVGEKDPSELFHWALTALPNACVCLMHTAQHGTWLGASPEELLHWEKGSARVDCIAGTLPIQNAPEDPNSWGEKEQHEQAVVTHAVIRAMENAAITDKKVNGPFVHHIGPIAHLRTVVEGNVRSDAVPLLIRELHPTPAVGGWPRGSANAFILENEPVDRGLYAGFWGTWHHEGTTDLFVNIRCMRIRPGKVALHVGGGITAGSDPAKEWEETEQKARTWTDALAARSSTRISSPEAS